MRAMIATTVFDRWLKALRDRLGKNSIQARLDRLANGNPGDAKVLGDGVTEMRVHIGPGYRVYFTELDGLVIILLCGGDKSTQTKDIERAKRMVRDLKE